MNMQKKMANGKIICMNMLESFVLLNMLVPMY